MMDEQVTKKQKRQKLSLRIRIIYATVFVAISAGFAVLWAAERGYFELSSVLGVCGFRQRFRLPCPGCGWTHAAQTFITGHPFRAFLIQPAAAFFSWLAALAAILSLLFAVIGVDFQLPKRIFCSKNSMWLLAAAIAIIVAGWIVTLARTIIENANL